MGRVLRVCQIVACPADNLGEQGCQQPDTQDKSCCVVHGISRRKERVFSKRRSGQPVVWIKARPANPSRALRTGGAIITTTSRWMRTVILQWRTLVADQPWVTNPIPKFGSQQESGLLLELLPLEFLELRSSLW